MSGPDPDGPRRRRRGRRRARAGAHARTAIVLLPNLVTTGALMLGFWSITQSIDGRFNAAAWAIIVAGVLDTLDGRIARATNSSTRFGVEYDSLVDVVCYGVAPGVLAYMWVLEPWIGTRGWPIGALFAICAALRLARFNAQVDVPRDHYVGIPSTAAGAVLTVTYWFVDWLGVSIPDAPVSATLIAAWFVALALLMVSPLPYPSWKSVPIVRRHAFSALVGVVLTLLLVLVNGEPALFTMAMLYIASGPWLLILLRRAAREAERLERLEREAAEAPRLENERWTP